MPSWTENLWCGVPLHTSNEWISVTWTLLDKLPSAVSRWATWHTKNVRVQTVARFEIEWVPSHAIIVVNIQFLFVSIKTQGWTKHPTPEIERQKNNMDEKHNNTAVHSLLDFHAITHKMLWLQKPFHGDGVPAAWQQAYCNCLWISLSRLTRITPQWLVPWWWLRGWLDAYLTPCLSPIITRA